MHWVLSEWYLGKIDNPAHAFWFIGTETIAEERADSIQIEGMDLDVEGIEALDAALMLGTSMIEGFVEWAAKQHDDFDVLDTELALFVDLIDNQGRPFTYAVRFDMLAEDSEGLWVKDFKTAKDFRARETVDQDPQFRRYPMILRKAYPDWADDVRGSEWVGLRKIIPSGRSKPPYFDRIKIDIAEREYEHIENELVAEVTDIFNVEDLLRSGVPVRNIIYASPTFNCAWNCDFFNNGMCRAWRSGLDITDLAEANGTLGHDPYEEYRVEFGGSVATTSRREGG